VDRSNYRRRSRSPDVGGGGGGRRNRDRSRSRSRSPRRDQGRREDRRRDERRDSRRGNERRRGGEQENGSSIAYSLSILAEAQLASKKRDDSRKSMLGRMSDEQADLFRLLSAKGWSDDNPKINSFTRKLVADKELNKAIDVIASELRKWPGQVSTKQLAMFLAKGYAAPDIHFCPGGFTTFMFRPKSAAFHRNPEEERNAIRAMFGDTKLDDEAVKYFAKQDFFLAETLADLEEQLRTTLDFLILLTRRGSIALEGYEFGLKFINENRQVFQLAIATKSNFCAKFAFVLDGVFQGFLNKLGQFHGKRNAISQAGRTLRGFQTEAILRTMGGFTWGSIPDLCMPAGLTERPEAQDDRRGNQATPKAAAKPAVAVKQEWWATNPSPESSWQIPAGKTYNDIFNGRDPILKKNLAGWPELKHHSQGRKKPLCIRYQSVGKCAATCTLSHQPPNQMPPSAKLATAKRFAEVYAS
jgi:hypothetical protein